MGVLFGVADMPKVEPIPSAISTRLKNLSLSSRPIDTISQKIQTSKNLVVSASCYWRELELICKGLIRANQNIISTVTSHLSEM